MEGLLLVGLCWFAGGLPLVPAGAVLAVAQISGRPRPRRLIAASVVLLGLVPVTWIMGNQEQWGDVTPALVLNTPLPGWLAASGLALLVFGVIQDHRQTARGEGTQ